MRTSIFLCLLLVFMPLMNHSLAAPFPPPSPTQQQPSSSAAALNNKDVIELVKAGLSSEIITTKIKSSKVNFDTSPTALQELKAAGVPDAVILTMVEGPSGTPAVAPVETASGAIAGESKALVYVYRKKNFNTRNMQPSVYVDGVEVARMDDGKFFLIKLEPGKHGLEVNKGHSGAQIDMKPGEQYYFRIDIKPGFLKGRSEVTYMQKEQGSLEVQKMKPLEEKWIKDKSKVSADEQTLKTQ
jgi:hypothetical protein